MSTPQSYANHTRRQPIFHFVLQPLLLINLIWSGYWLLREPSGLHAQMVLIAVALELIAFLARINPLAAQDRVIRLEEQLRYQRVLPADLLQAAERLTPRQMIALRFASDAELADLVRRTLAGQFASPKEIKQAVRTWRADHLRV